MTAKHTPGPWRVDPANLSDVQSASGLEIATAMDVVEEGAEWTIKGPCPTKAAGLANARLIAEAPDLLSIAERWAAIDGGAWHVERHAREKAELLADTKAAIARAAKETDHEAE